METIKEAAEKWEYIPGFNRMYKVSNLGRIKSYKRNGAGKILSLAIKDGGYVHVGLSQSYKNRKNFSVHRLVAMTFLSNYSEFLEVNHINGDKTDNRVCNLEMCNRSENMKHAYDVLNIPVSRAWLGKMRENHPSSIPIIEIDEKGNSIRRFSSIKEAAIEYKLLRCSISLVCKGRLKTTGGKRFKFAPLAAR